MGRHALQQQSSRLVKSDIRRQRYCAINWNSNQLRIGKGYVSKRNSVPNLNMPNVLRYRLDDPSPFISKYIWRLPCQMIIAFTAIDVCKIKSDRFHSNEKLISC
ncbi:hypothetical protein D3C85_1568210 [compost metagenome]